MRLSAIAALAASIQLAAAGAAIAATSSTGMMHGGAMKMARCSPGDPNVLVNKMTKTFILDPKGKAKKTGSMAGGSMADSNPNASEADPKKKSSMVSMCKSEATSMGAKMSSGGMKKKGSM